MSSQFIYLLIYYLAAGLYWTTYLLFRPKVQSNFFRIIMLINTIHGIIILGIVPLIYLKINNIFSPITLFICFTMVTMGVIHHISLIKDRIGWKGLFPPIGFKIPFFHGAFTHIIFSLSFAGYGMLLFQHFNPYSVLLGEKMLLFIVVMSMEIIGVIAFLNGLIALKTIYED